MATWERQNQGGTKGVGFATVGYDIVDTTAPPKVLMLEFDAHGQLAVVGSGGGPVKATILTALTCTEATYSEIVLPPGSIREAAATSAKACCS